MTWLLRLLVRLVRRRRYRDMTPRILEMEMQLGIVEPTARRRNELRRLRGELQPQRPTRGGYMAGDVTVSEMGPVPDVLTKPGIGATR